MNNQDYIPAIVETLPFYNNKTNDMKWGNCIRINGQVIDVQLYNTQFDAILDFDNYTQNILTKIKKIHDDMIKEVKS